MKLNINQTKLIKLTMQMDLKAKEYKKLCEKLEELKANRIDSNDKKFEELKRLFEYNYKEIVKINTELKKLENV